MTSSDLDRELQTGEQTQLLAYAAGDLLVWTITFGTSDYPGRFVARPHSSRLERPLFVVLLGDTLEALREKLPPGLHRQPRDASDDPVILETWF